MATSLGNIGSGSEEGDGDEPRKPRAGWEKIIVDLEADERNKEEQENEDDRRAGKNRKRQKMEAKQAIAALLSPRPKKQPKWKPTSASKDDMSRKELEDALVNTHLEIAKLKKKLKVKQEIMRAMKLGLLNVADAFIVNEDANKKKIAKDRTKRRLYLFKMLRVLIMNSTQTEGIPVKRERYHSFIEGACEETLENLEKLLKANCKTDGLDDDKSEEEDE